jgi:putative FmdB family regulatory protein
MTTYEYECEFCGLKIEHRQSIEEEPLTEYPQFQGRTWRLIGGRAEALRLLDMFIRTEKATAVLARGRILHSVIGSIRVSRS